MDNEKRKEYVAAVKLLGGMSPDRIVVLAKMFSMNVLQLSAAKLMVRTEAQKDLLQMIIDYKNGDLKD